MNSPQRAHPLRAFFDFIGSMNQRQIIINNHRSSTASSHSTMKLFYRLKLYTEEITRVLLLDFIIAGSESFCVSARCRSLPNSVDASKKQSQCQRNRMSLFCSLKV